MDAKSFQNASKKPTKNQMNFALKKSRKMDLIWGSRGGPTNQLFTPKIQSGTPWAPQGAPEGLQKVPWTIFDRIWSRFHDILIVLRSFFLWFPTQFRIKMDLFCNWQNKYLIEELLNTSWNQLKNLTNFHKKYAYNDSFKNNMYYPIDF